MRIVILTAVPFWHPGTLELINELRKKGMSIVALDIFHGRFFNENNEIKNLIPFQFKGIFAKIYLYLFRKKFVKRHVKDDDILDIHFVEPYYAKYILDLPNKLICSVFGSDLFRTTQQQRQMQFPIFEKANRIVLSENMVPYFEENFRPMSSKYSFNQYGSKRLDSIIQQKNSINIEELKIRLNIPSGKLVVTVGYNNKKEQQHLSIINELQKLSPSFIKNIFFIFPMTYGDSGLKYLFDVKQVLQQSSFSFLILENSLSDQEIVEYRLLSDLTINMQTTDALASSIKEAFAAGDLLLIGDWLPYEIYDDLGVFYQKIKFNSLTNHLEEAVATLKEKKIYLDKNSQIIENFASWNQLISSWSKLYKTV